MINVFIGYGGPEAQRVADDLQQFLFHEGLNPFLASPQSPSLRSIDSFDNEIRKNLLNCEIVVFVCHKSTPQNQNIQREINFLYDSKFEDKIITFAKCDYCIPVKLRKSNYELV